MVRPPRRLLRRSVGERLAKGRSIGDVLDDELGRLRVGPLAEGTFTSPLHSERTASLLGIALGITFFTCFLTGLYSHFIQNPLEIGFLSQPTTPGWLFRFTQGLHVASGTASIPLLLAKLWTIYPKLFEWPPARNAAHIVERASLPLLIGGSLFMLMTGLLNTTRWYPWEFNFTATHFWTAWITIGALVAHIGAKIVIVRRNVGPAARKARVAVAEQPRANALSRRGFIATAFAASGVLTLTTIGQTFRPLKELALLAPRKPDVGPQGVPVNKSAAGARVIESASDALWRLRVDGRVREPLELSLADLRAMPQRKADHAIACVEGWSARASWRGVPVRDLLELAGARDGARVTVKSLQRRGRYSKSKLNPAQASDPDTLLALELNGEALHIDHGFPCRLIGPNRPGVQQTKWVSRLEVS